jgi:hypothetical protein
MVRYFMVLVALLSVPACAQNLPNWLGNGRWELGIWRHLRYQRLERRRAFRQGAHQ